ncbi:MAG: RICIN domain-containing protein [Phycicoccus sp.]
MHVRTSLAAVMAVASIGLAATSATASEGGGETSAPTAVPASASSAVQIFQFLKARHSGKDLVVLNASTAANAPIGQFTRNSGANQQWEQINLPTAPSTVFAPDRQFRNKQSGLCLDVRNNSLSPEVVVQNPCNADDPAQRWIVTKVAQVFSPNGGFRHYANRNSGLVLDISEASTANNAQLIQFPKTGGDNQLFEQSFGSAS